MGICSLETRNGTNENWKDGESAAGTLTTKKNLLPSLHLKSLPLQLPRIIHKSLINHLMRSLSLQPRARVLPMKAISAQHMNNKFKII